MKRFTSLFVFALIGALIYGTSVFALVNNGDLEAGTFASWTQSTFINNGFSSAPGVGGADLSAIVGGSAVAPLSMSDTNSNGAIMFPAYGHYSARVNSDQSYTGPGHGQNGNRMSQTVPAYLDPVDNKAHIRFTYAAVMVDPAHTADQQPYFRVRAVNTSNSNDVLYDFTSYVGEPGKNWQNGVIFSAGVYWKYLDWNFIDLTPTAGHPVNAGDNVMLEITAAGCSPGGHPGYVYVDEISDHEIAGPTVTATGPATVQSGNTVTYTYKYRNGSAGTINAAINATQPAGVTFTSVSDPAHCTVGSTVTCNFPNVASLSTGSFTVTGNTAAAVGSQIAHGNYNIASPGFPTIGGQTVFTSVAAVPTTTTVTAAPNPSVYGQSVALTAAVAPTSGSTVPTGTVQFVVDGSNFGSPVALSSGTATLNTTALGVSAGHTVSAVYSGDSSCLTSNGSLSGNLVVNKANAAVGVLAAPNPAVSGQPITLTANVGAAAPGSGTPGGTVTFYVDGAAVCTTVPLAGGSASCPAGTFSPGNHTVTVTYSGNGNFNGGGGSIAGGLDVNKANTTLGLSASPDPSVAGEAVTITANVAPVAPGTGIPTGTVAFKLDGNTVCPAVSLSGGQASCPLPAMGAGGHAVTATYSGDGSFNGSGGTLSGGLTVNKANTSLALTASPNPSVAGQAVTVTATVAPVAPGTGTPSGTVAFSLDGNVVCTSSSLSSGQATCNLPPMGAGGHTVTASYSGDGNFNVSNGTLAGGLTVNKANTTLGLSASPNPSVAGESVLVTATVAPVSPGTGTPSGTVAFSLDGNVVCPVASVIGAQATCSLPPMGAGGHTLTATYSGDNNFNVSNGNLAGGLTVNKANTATTLSASPNPSVSGQAVTITAAVAPVPPGTGTPGGTITFKLDGNTVCPNVALSGSQATCNLPAMGAGGHAVTTTYGGDSNFNGSNGTLAGGLTVNKADTTLALVGAPTSSIFGQQVIFTATISISAPGTGAPSGNVTFRDNGVGIGTCVAQSVSTSVATCSISTLSVGTHPITAVYNGDGSYNASPASNTVTQVVDPLTDLSMTMSDGASSAAAGSAVAYTIVVSNAGPSTAAGAIVTDIFPSAIVNAQWTCVGAGGGTCNSSGSGNIGQPVTLPAGGSTTFTVTARISPTATGTLANTATVTAPAGTTDPNVANNSASDTDTLTGPSVFVIDDVQKLEGQAGATSFTFTVSKLGATGFATAVSYQTYDGTATAADGDYQPASGTLNFGPLDTEKTLTVTVNGDITIESNEIFYVRLLSPAVNALIQDPEGRGLILNDDDEATPTPTPTPTPNPTPVPNRFEGDINRTVLGVPGIGDGDVTVGDQIEYQRFLGGLDCPSPNEQPRLDAGSRSTLGDGMIGSLDGAAIDAYARHDASTDYDPNTPGWQMTPVGGPAVINNLGCTPTADPEGENLTTGPMAEPETVSAARVVRVVSRSGSRSSDVTVDIEMTAQGNEAGTQYSLHFDPAVLSISSISGANVNPDVTLGAGAPEGTVLNVNADDAANGNIGIIENFTGGATSLTAISAGTTRIARLKFHVLEGAKSGSSRIAFDESVIRGYTADVNGFGLTATYEGGDVSVTASHGLTVSGRVTSSDGRGLRGATVTMVDGEGRGRTATTSAFGNYVFDEVPAATYTLAVSSRLYRYASRTVDITDNLADVDFTGLE